MTVELAHFIERIEPNRTVLLFGAGSSVPSGAPSADQLRRHLAGKFNLPSDNFTLSELASLIEQRVSRRALVEAIRERFGILAPTRGLLNLPLYPWKSLFTTNYDDLIEQCYKRQGRDLTVYSSNFDFTTHENPLATKLFKLHGTIDKDISDGNVSRLIITDADNDATAEYREGLYHRLQGDLVGGHLVVIGHALQDADIREIVNRTAALAAKAASAWKMSLLLFEKDEHRASLFESRGFTVCFGGIDEFFSSLAQNFPRGAIIPDPKDPLYSAPDLRPSTIDVEHETAIPCDVSAMFNGRPASYSDIANGLTFERNVAEEVTNFIDLPTSICAVILGASGVGKTTAARQAVQHLRRSGHLCWEHFTDHVINVRAWTQLAKQLHADHRHAILVVDDAHSHLQEFNDLVDGLVSNRLTNLKLIAISTRNHWNPRVKSPNIYKLGQEFILGRLAANEIDRLLNLVDSSPQIRALVEQTFAGFSRFERRRRLIDRCESETFVCLKNIFASEKFDDIILREYAELDEPYQEIYRRVATMESAGVRVHRQLIIRLLGIPAADVASVLGHLKDIVHEYAIDEREGIYGWRGRHAVIVSIIAHYKYADPEKFAELLAQVIDHISPTYEIEIRTVRELCNVESGLTRIPDKEVQNRLLRKMMSSVPGERVPRHRLIRNLIDMGEFEKAETEIRIFDKDFGRDGPVARYKVALLTARARNTPGLLEEDRRVILEQAVALAENSIKRFPNNKSLLAAYCEVGIEIYRRSGDYSTHDRAIALLKEAEERMGDPEIVRLVARYEARIRGTELSPSAEEDAEE